MKTTKEMIEVMQAFEEGGELQCYEPELKEWIGCTPVWDWLHYDYRIKPEPKEPTYRPYESADELIADYKARFNVDNAPYTKPLIWIKQVGRSQDRGALIISFDEDKVWINGVSFIMRELCMYYTYLDGTPCGKRVKK